MRKLVYLIIAAAAIYSGYWYIGQRAVENHLAAWFEERRDDGWVADYAALDTRGYPNRFDTTIEELQLADPETGVAWTAPFFQILALSYRPNHVIVAFPHQQTIASPFEEISVGAEEMRGSVVFRPGPSLALDRATFVMHAMELAGGTGWQAALDEGRFAVRLIPAHESRYEIGVEALGLRPGEATRAALDPTGGLPETVERLHLDATIGFDRPWDRSAIETARPQPVAVDLDDLSAKWGDLELRAAGELDVDAEGVPQGKITVKAVNWREMLEIAVASGTVPEGLADTIEGGLQLLAGLSGARDTLDVPLTFADGRVSLGPVPLGRAPLLRLR